MDIEKFLQAKMAERTKNGLKIVIQREDGSAMVIYPKDNATRARWLAGYLRKGITILEQ